jgi:hypothetical protein
MRVKYWMAMALLFSLPVVHAEESDPPIELIEMLGETDQVEADLEIAMSDIEVKVTEKETHPQEVKDDE